MIIWNWLTRIVRMFVFVCVSGLAAANGAFAGISDLEIYPWDLDQELRCYASDSLESQRPATSYATPLELIAQQVRTELEAKEALLETATLALSAAETAARPVLNPSVAYTKNERIDDFEVYLAVLVANLVRADIQAAYLEDRLASLDGALA